MISANVTVGVSLFASCGWLKHTRLGTPPPVNLSPIVHIVSPALVFRIACACTTYTYRHELTLWTQEG